MSPSLSDYGRNLLVTASDKLRRFPYYLSIAAIARDEGPYLLEWLEFHRMVGVDHFYFYDNGSMDNTKDILRPYLEQNIVEVIDWPGDPDQPACYMDCIRRFKDRSSWIAVIDVDEFIVPVATSTVPEFLREFESANGLGVNEFVYGSSGHRQKPLGLQTANFLRRLEKDHIANLHIKSIVNPRKVTECCGGHHFKFLDGQPVVSESHWPIRTGPRSLRNQTQKIRINHYFTRSQEEYAKKMARHQPGAFGGIRRPDDFAIHDQNNEFDDMMKKYFATLEERIARVKNSLRS
jgi:hypothetical protein